MKKFLLAAFILTNISVFAQLPSFKVEGTYPGLYLEHTVSQDQNFLVLARIFNLSPNIIASFNNMKLGATLQRGQLMKIPLTVTNFKTSEEVLANSNFIPLYLLLTEDGTIASISKKAGVADTSVSKLNATGTTIFKSGSKVSIGYLKIRKDQAVFLNTPPEDKPIVSTNSDTAKTVSKDTTTLDVSDFDSDKLFRQARRAAFDKKDYSSALQLCNLALTKSPGYSDIRIFTGRIFTWTGKLDSARQAFKYVLQNDPENKELYVAFTDLEYWNDEYNSALEICEKGLSYNSNSSDLLIRKVKILKALKRPAEAQKVLEKILKTDRTNTEARALIERNKDEVLRNKIGASYEYTYFDKQFNDPWHIATIDYSRQTKLGSVAGHIWYANRFKSGGLQYELEAYPHISKHLYSYISGAYSDNVGVFPKYRGGFSLYGILPKSMEGELGIRYLHFSSSTVIFTAALSKYYKSWLFTGRTYITPGDNDISQSYNIVTRYYYGGADDYFSFTIGRGISPDDRPQSVFLNKQYQKLVSMKAGVGYRHEFNKKYVLDIAASWINQEYRPQTKGNQLSTGISYQVRF